MRSNVHHLLEEHACSRPDAPALTYLDETVSYRRLWDCTRGAAAGLAMLGLQRGERVAVYLEKRIDTVVAIFGTSLAGGVFVPVNPALRAPQVRHILDDCAVTVLVTSPTRFGVLQQELLDCPGLRHVVLVGAGQQKDNPRRHYRVHSWPVVCGESGTDAAPIVAVETDIAAILYTSGSTGRPKGVILSHRNLIAGAESVAQYLQNTADDVVLAVLPLSFDAGFSQLTTAFSVGAHVVLANYLRPADIPRLCARHGVTALTCVPPLWIQIAEQPWTAAAAVALRYFANTGGRLPKPTLDKLRALFPLARPFLMYGLTEAFRSTYLDPEEVDRRPDSIGKAIPGTEIIVARPDGSVCDPGEEGELVHRGPSVALGYWNDPVRSAERFKPWHLHPPDNPTTERVVWSGDTVVADEEGFLYFVGRADEMIKTSGYRVSPTEIEEVAYATQWVGGAIAVGVADECLGQRVVLVVSPADPESFDTVELLAVMRAHLPLYMVPSEVTVWREIPRSPNGKFDRNAIREALGP